MYCLSVCLVVGSHVFQASLVLALIDKNEYELLILPPLPSECWDYSSESPLLVPVGLGMEPRASCMLGSEQHSTQ